MRIRHFLFIFFALLFSLNAGAQEKEFGLNPFLTQEEREKFKEKSKYEILLGPKLEAVLYNPGYSKAVIDGRIVREGDAVDGKKVLQINPDSVILTDLQRKFILQVSNLAPSIESEMVEQRKDKDE